MKKFVIGYANYLMDYFGERDDEYSKNAQHVINRLVRACERGEISINDCMSQMSDLT